MQFPCHLRSNIHKYADNSLPSKLLEFFLLKLVKMPAQLHPLPWGCKPEWPNYFHLIWGHWWYQGSVFFVYHQSPDTWHVFTLDCAITYRMKQSSVVSLVHYGKWTFLLTSRVDRLYKRVKLGSEYWQTGSDYLYNSCHWGYGSRCPPEVGFMSPSVAL